jgi:hypothetical protein
MINRKTLCKLIVLVLMMTSCSASREHDVNQSQNGNTSTTPFGTTTVSPTSNDWWIQTQEPTQISEPETNSESKLNLPKNLEVITEENAPLIKELTSIGKGNGFSTIYTVLVSPDGYYMILDDVNNRSTVWDLEKQEIIYEAEYSVLNFSPDSQNFLAINYEGHGWILELRRIKDQKIISKMSGISTDSINGIDDHNVIFSPDESLLAAGYQSIFVWNTKTGEQLHQLNGSGEVMFSPDGSMLSSNDRYNDKGVDVWRMSDGKSILSTSEVGSSLFSSDNRYFLLINYYSDKLSIWDLNTGGLVGEISYHSINSDRAKFVEDPFFAQLPSATSGALKNDILAHFLYGDSFDELENAIGRASYATGTLALDKKLVISKPDDGVVHIYGIPNDALPEVVWGDRDVNILQTLYSPDGSELAGINEKGIIYIWDTNKRQLINSWDTQIVGDNDTLEFLPPWDFPSNKMIALSAGYKMWIWSVPEGDLLYELDPSELGLQDTEIINFRISPDGNYLAYPLFRYNSFTLAIYNLRNKTNIDLPEHIRAESSYWFPSANSFSPDGQMFAVLSIDYSIPNDTFIYILNTNTWESLMKIPLIMNPADLASIHIVFSSNSNFLSDSRTIWETRNWNQVGTYKPDIGLFQFFISDTGNLIAFNRCKQNTSDQGFSLIIVNFTTGEEILSQEFPLSYCQPINMSPDWKYATHTDGYVVRFYKLPEQLNP